MTGFLFVVLRKMHLIALALLLYLFSYSLTLICQCHYVWLVSFTTAQSCSIILPLTAVTLNHTLTSKICKQ